MAKIAFDDAVRARTRALMDLARLHGFITERYEVRSIRGAGDLTDEELTALASETSFH